MVIKKFIVSLSLLLFMSQSIAQDLDFYAGINIVPNRVNDNYLGINLGALTAFHSKSRLVNFQTGMNFDLFRQPQAIFSPPHFPGTERAVGQLSFLTIPLHLRIKVSSDKNPNQRLYWRLGYDYGILLQSRRTMHFEDGTKTIGYNHQFFQTRNFLHHNGLTFGFQYERTWFEKHRIGINAHYRYHYYGSTFKHTAHFGSFNFGLNYGLLTKTKQTIN
jgi:hypothetical protein